MSLPPSEVRASLRGVAVGLLTPFDDNLDIDYDGIKYNARRLYEAGPRTFLAAANISEYHSLSQRERIRVVETSADALPDDACVLAGVGGSTAEARRLIEGYDDIGVDGMMIMPPDHTYVHECGIIEYYEKLAAATDTPLIPYVRGFDPSVNFLVDLANIDGVIGVKYALEDPVKLGEATSTAPDDIVWVNGLAEPFAVSFWNEGIEGFSAGVSNFRPVVGLELFEALSAGEFERARSIRNICMPFQRFRDETGADNVIGGAVSVPAVKKGLELAGYRAGDGRVREPLQPLCADDESRAEALYHQLEDDIDRVIG